jgi:hypothetical protein
MFVADNVWAEDDNTDDDEHQAKELNDDDEGDADEVEVFSIERRRTGRVSDWAKKVDVMTSRLTILDVSNLCPDVADVGHVVRGRQ